MKKTICIILALALFVCAFAACNKKETENNSETTAPADAAATAPDAGKLSIVTTIFPEYDWVRNIAGDKLDGIDLTLLLDNGADLHSYQPTFDDIMKVSECDLFIYVGGESDEWVDDVLKSTKNDKMVVINLLEALGDSAKTEEVKEGMEADHEHEHEEIEPDEIEDRTLSEFSGEWKSILPMLQDGSLSEYVKHEMEEDGASEEEIMAELNEKWACDAVKVSIKDDSIGFTYADGKVAEAKYVYDGYAPITGDDGDITGVRYQFKTDDAEAPAYVQFADHNHAPAEEVEHFHIWFGSDGYEALLGAENAPFFVSADAAAEDVVAELTEGHEHEEEFDEHVWLSLKNSAALCDTIAAEMGKIDAANAQTYKANADAYIARLNELDAEYRAAVDGASVKTLLFADRFPFRYLVDDYGLDYYAAFSGCSAEAEASFETISFLSKKVDELGLKAIMQIETADGSIAKTVKSNTQTRDQQILTINSIQSVSAEDVADGASYLEMMRENLTVLKEALG